MPVQSEFKAIQEKLEATKQEMSQIQSKYTELQKSSEVDRKAWADDKKLLEGTIFELTTSERQGESDRTSREGEVRQQEERAKVSYHAATSSANTQVLIDRRQKSDILTKLLHMLKALSLLRL